MIFLHKIKTEFHYQIMYTYTCKVALKYRIYLPIGRSISFVLKKFNLELTRAYVTLKI